MTNKLKALNLSKNINETQLNGGVGLTHSGILDLFVLTRHINRSEIC